MTSSKEVLLTGGSGFVGANLARRLLRDGHRVHLLLRPGYDAWRIEGIQRDVVIHLADLRNRDAVARTVAEVRPQWVFHLAAHGAYPDQSDAEAIRATIVGGLRNLLDSCRTHGCEKFINAGSSSEYGPKDHAPAESEETEPVHEYGVAKCAATELCGEYASRYGVRTATLRLYSVYGPFERQTRLIPTLLRSAMGGCWPQLVDAAMAHDFVYVEDVVDAFVVCAGAAFNPRSIFNVGSGVQTTLEQLVTAVQKLLPIEAEPKFGTMPTRTWDTPVWVANPRKIREDLGWQARYSLEEGLQATFRWMRGVALL